MGQCRGGKCFPLPGEKALENNENNADLMFNAMENWWRASGGDRWVNMTDEEANSDNNS